MEEIVVEYQKCSRGVAGYLVEGRDLAVIAEGDDYICVGCPDAQFEACPIMAKYHWYICDGWDEATDYLTALADEAK